jgi:hypothetical protein
MHMRVPGKQDYWQKPGALFLADCSDKLLTLHAWQFAIEQHKSGQVFRTVQNFQRLGASEQMVGRSGRLFLFRARTINLTSSALSSTISIQDSFMVCLHDKN